MYVRSRQSNPNQKDQIRFVDGEIQIIKPDISALRESNRADMEIIEKDENGRFLNKKSAPRWNKSKDEEKFFDALFVFGQKVSIIHSLVFDPMTALESFDNPEDFTERSL